MALFNLFNSQAKTSKKLHQAIDDIRDDGEYIMVIESLDHAVELLGGQVERAELESIKSAVESQGHAFRFCHLVLAVYYIAFEKTQELAGFIDKPENWRTIIPADYIISISKAVSN
ncbi:hypothetical protein [Vibrio barjaei]|uniref:hypothetical protein n=1 Tax=Vibrio barjaei TaxID=1676683 RepID=UPI002284CD36|nr:hypothetical protein [Vibrio barjaei]MCY9873859.1 hypothetical protein [Vibrio barjaei]